MYPTLNGKTSIHKSLDDLDRPQTHIISPGMSDKGKLVGGVSFYSQPTRSLIVSFRFDQELVHCILFDPF